MFVSIDLCLVPIGVGTSLSPYIKECIEVIKSEGLSYELGANGTAIEGCLLYTSPSPRDRTRSRMPSSA